MTDAADRPPAGAATNASTTLAGTPVSKTAEAPSPAPSATAPPDDPAREAVSEQTGPRQDPAPPRAPAQTPTDAYVRPATGVSPEPRLEPKKSDPPEPPPGGPALTGKWPDGQKVSISYCGTIVCGSLEFAWNPQGDRNVTVGVGFGEGGAVAKGPASLDEKSSIGFVTDGEFEFKTGSPSLHWSVGLNAVSGLSGDYALSVKTFGKRSDSVGTIVNVDYDGIVSVTPNYSTDWSLGAGSSTQLKVTIAIPRDTMEKVNKAQAELVNSGAIGSQYP
jgi:hypothetical protein